LEDLPAAALSYKEEGKHKHHHHHHHHNKISPQDRLLSQIAEWIQTEKTKKAAKKAKRKEAKEKQGATHLEIAITTTAQRRESSDSDSSGLSLDKLQKILEDDKQASRDPTPTASPNLLPRSPNLLPRRPSYSSRKKSGSRSRRPSVPPRAASSDTEYYDGDAIVPSCDVVLDNSKTLSYTGGAAVTPSVSTASSDLSLGSIAKKAEKESNVWSVFKHEILKLAHTLRLKGWRRIPLEKGDDIEVVRLSGALTNAVYVVLPPKDHPLPKHHGEHAHETPRPRKPPAKLLLRIYGPQVEHLIDRESELSILRRLARKKIGPRMLGTFRNGRFEEYFDSTTLTAEDLRIKETSRAIAKRMRELHEGIELEEEEREAGPRVWGNWEKWVGRCEIVIGWLDKQVLAQGGAKSGKDAWRRKGFVCGVRWPMFRAMVEKYRRRLEEEYGGKGGIKEKLVFAHNDVSLFPYFLV
jgi:choline kinase